MIRLMTVIAGVVILAAPGCVTNVDAAGRIVRSAQFHPPGHQLRRLPRGHIRITVGPERYHYYGGMFLRPVRSGYIVVSAPIGARIRTLPRGYVSFGIGTRSYFFVNSAFYLWEPQTREYIVVAEPVGAAEHLAVAQEPTDSASLFVYPNQGQDQEQTRRDRYDCHLWAADQSGYDPTYADQAVGLRGDYRRAMTACLEGRGYTVR